MIMLRSDMQFNYPKHAILIILIILIITCIIVDYDFLLFDDTSK